MQIDRRLRFALALVAVSLMLHGCATPESVDPAVSVPSNWRYADPEQPFGQRERWWGAIGDPTLSSLIEDALNKNRDIAKAGVRLGVWQLRVASERTGMEWNSSVGTTAAVTSDLAKSSTLGLDHSMRSYSMSVLASYEPDLWSRLAATTKLTSNEMAISRNDVEVARWLITIRVAQAYWRLAANREMARLAAENLRDTEVGLEVARLRASVGKARIEETMRWEAAAASDADAVRDLEADRNLLSHELAQLLDHHPEDWDPPEAQLPPHEWPAVNLSTPMEVLDRRPDVRSARVKLDSAAQQVRIAKANRYPQISLGLAIDSGGASPGSLLSNPLATLSAAMLAPLLEQGRLALLQEAAIQQQKEAVLMFQDAVGTALVEVESEVVEQHRLSTLYASTQARLRQAKRALDIAELRYAAGAGSRQVVRDAARALRSEKANLAELQVRGWLNMMALHRATGGTLPGDESSASSRGRVR